MILACALSVAGFVFLRPSGGEITPRLAGLTDILSSGRRRVFTFACTVAILIMVDWRALTNNGHAYWRFVKVIIYRPGRFGRANPRAGPWSRGGWTSSCNRSAVISSGPEASICHSTISDSIDHHTQVNIPSSRS